MTKSELIAAIVAKADGKISKVGVDTVLEKPADLIQEAASQGRELVLPGVGKFSVSERSARPGRNPQTGEAVTIAARRVPKFSAASVLKRAASQSSLID